MDSLGGLVDLLDLADDQSNPRIEQRALGALEVRYRLADPDVMVAQQQDAEDATRSASSPSCYWSSAWWAVSGRRPALLALGILVLIALQPPFVLMRDSSPALAALHPVNGFLILLAAIVFAWGSWQSRTETV
jgi:hypothetical protein